MLLCLFFQWVKHSLTLWTLNFHSPLQLLRTMSRLRLRPHTKICFFLQGFSFFEDVYILTWETDVNIKEKGCVSTKLKVCEKCLKWSRNCSCNSWWGLQSSAPFLFHSGGHMDLTSPVFVPWPRYCLWAPASFGAPGFAEAVLSGRSFMTLRYWFPLKWMI